MTCRLCGHALFTIEREGPCGACAITDLDRMETLIWLGRLTEGWRRGVVRVQQLP